MELLGNGGEGREVTFVAYLQHARLRDREFKSAILCNNYKFKEDSILAI